jgi:hypothetical protein
MSYVKYKTRVPFGVIEKCMRRMMLFKGGSPWNTSAVPHLYSINLQFMLVFIGFYDHNNGALLSMKSIATWVNWG